MAVLLPWLWYIVWPPPSPPPPHTHTSQIEFPVFTDVYESKERSTNYQFEK